MLSIPKISIRPTIRYAPHRKDDTPARCGKSTRFRVDKDNDIEEMEPILTAVVNIHIMICVELYNVISLRDSC